MAEVLVIPGSGAAVATEAGQVWPIPGAGAFVDPTTGAGAYTLNAESGSFTVTGTAVGTLFGRKIPAESGTFAVTGTAAGLERGYKLSAESGTFAATGTAADLEFGRKLTADSGTFAVAGQDATLTYGQAGQYSLNAESGSFTVSGTAVGLLFGREIAAESGAFAVTGTAAGLVKGYRLVADAGAFTVSGTDVAFKVNRVLQAESGAFGVIGSDATLTYSAQPVVEVTVRRGGPAKTKFKDTRHPKRKPYLVRDDVIVPERVTLPEVSVKPPVEPAGDTFQISVSESAQELQAQLLAEVLKAYKVERVTDLSSEDEEEVVTIVSLLAQKLMGE